MESFGSRQLSAVEQLTDSLQSERGNPNLKPYSYYRSTFRLDYSKGKWDIGLRNQYNYRDKAIMPHIYREGMTTCWIVTLNHSSFQGINGNFFSTFTPLIVKSPKFIFTSGQSSPKPFRAILTVVFGMHV